LTNGHDDVQNIIESDNIDEMKQLIDRLNQIQLCALEKFATDGDPQCFMTICRHHIGHQNDIDGCT
jgi:hypothetical protein